MVLFEALDVAHIQIARHKAPVAIVICKSNQPIGNLVVSNIELTLEAVAGLADT